MNDKPVPMWPLISYVCFGAAVGLGYLCWSVALAESSRESGPSMAVMGQAIMLTAAIHAAGIWGVFAGIKGRSRWATGLNLAAIVVFWIAVTVAPY